NTVDSLGSVVLGSDWWHRWQFNSLAVGGRADCLDFPINNRAPGCGLRKTPSLQVNQGTIQGERLFLKRGGSMRYEDELKGKGKQVKGSAKEELGKLTGDRDLEERGREERFKGNIQEKVGKGRRKVGEAIEDVGGKIAGKR